MEDWGWPDGKWMKGLLVPRQGHMERRKFKKNKTFVSFGIWGGGCEELCVNSSKVEAGRGRQVGHRFMVELNKE